MIASRSGCSIGSPPLNATDLRAELGEPIDAASVIVSVGTGADTLSYSLQ